MSERNTVVVGVAASWLGLVMWVMFFGWVTGP